MRFPILLAFISLGACSPSPNSEIAPERLSGRDIFMTRCTICHQVDGGGIPGNCPPFQGSPRLAGPSHELIEIVLLGKKGPVVRDGRTYNGIMPAWRHDLNDEQVAAVLNEILSRWHPERGLLTKEEVAAVRKSTENSPLFPTNK